MAEHYDPGLLPRTYFRAPRVPFDFRALVLGIGGWLVFWSGGLLISEIFGKADVPGSFLALLGGVIADVPYIGREVARLLGTVFFVNVENFPSADYTGWHVLVGGAWFVAVWSFVGQGIHRITTMRIARDEGLSLGQALRFSLRNWATVLLVPVIIAGVIGFFWLCNMFAGVLTSIPFAGGLLGLVLIPLTFISTLLILLVALGGVFGFPLIGAAAAWECNGSLDAISRAFSYLFARPLQYFWNFFLIFLFTGIILLVGRSFVTTQLKSVDDGTWSTTQSQLIDRPARGSEDHQNFDQKEREQYNKFDEKTGGATPFARHFQAVVHAPWAFKLNALLFWVIVNLILCGVYGYATYWLIGASTSVYADLRADVDGTEEDEVYIEEEEAEFDALAEGGPVTEGAAAEEAEAQATPEPAAETPEPPAEDEGEAPASESEGDADGGDEDEKPEA